jgi:hypothetical protein
MDPSDPVDNLSISAMMAAGSGSGSGSGPAFSNSNPETVKVFALDISGSMGVDATDGKESTGKQNVELVAEITSSVVDSMTENQFAGVVVFNHSASTLCPISEMNDLNRSSMSKALKGMNAGGSTNLWGAIELSMRLEYAHCKKIGKMLPCSIDLLTDGVPNVDPPNLRGYEASLSDLSMMLDGFSPKINIFGFGNNLDVPLLESIAFKTGGHFSYISDPGMAATAFVNSAAAWGAQDNQVVLDPVSEACRRDLASALRAMRTSCSLSNFAGAQDCNQKLIKSIESSISSAPAGSPPTYILAEFLKDLYGEVALSVSDQAVFKKWGNNYLTSLSRAHELKICANFKDKGLQIYQTSPNFPILQTRIARIFTTVMARLATEGEARAAAIGSAAAISTSRMNSNALANMYNPHGGCVDGRCIVSMADGSFKHLENVEIGDFIFGGVDGRTVVEVYEKVITKPKLGTDLAYFSNSGFVAGGLSSSFTITTAWHPVRHTNNLKYGDQWQFPCKSSIPKILAPSGSINDHGFENVVSIAVRGVNGESKDEVYGFLVNNSIVCATLAHGVKGDPVLEHAFWGTDLVIDAIKDMKTSAKKRGIMNPIVGTGPFSWKFSASFSTNSVPDQCIGIAEAELFVPFAPRLTSKQIRHKTEMLEIVKNALLSAGSDQSNPSSMFLVSDLSGGEGDDGNEF